MYFAFYFHLGSIPLTDVDEGAFSEATREMLARGDYVSTYLNGLPRFDKPILIYWLQALSVGAFGVNELAFRLPSALCATGWVVLVTGFLRGHTDEVTALLGGGLVAGSLAVTVIGRAATADALLNLLIAGSMLAIYRYFSERRRRHLYAAHALIGLGLLAKGPIALLIPGAVSLLHAALRRELGTWWRAALSPGPLALLVAIAAPWYVLQYLRQGQPFIEGFFLHHNLDRFQGPMEGHGGSLWYYLPVILLAVLPYSGLLIAVLLRPRELWRDELQRYLLLWLVFVVGFFSLSGTKLPHYVLYGCTGAYMLMALRLAELRSRVLSWLPMILYFGALLAAPALVERLLPRLSDPYARAVLGQLDGVVGWPYYAAGAGGLLLALLLMVDGRLDLRLKLLAAGAACAAAVSGLVLPTVAELQQAPIEQAAAIANARGYKVVLWRLNAPSFSVYTRRVTARRDPLPGEIVLTKAKQLQALGEHRLLYQRGGIALVQKAPE